MQILRWNNWELPEHIERDDDEDPSMWFCLCCCQFLTNLCVDKIQGIESSVMDDLGMPRRRDPDALPPHNGFEWLMNKLYHGVANLGGGNALFALKAGVLTS